MNLQQLLEAFLMKWSPKDGQEYQEFLYDLRLLLEAYGKAALIHQSLPDTEHEHGAPV